MRAFLKTVTLAVLPFCIFLAPIAKAAPSITSLSPTSGAIGASVTITGTNFGTTQGSSTVKFNTTTATTITSWSATSIVVPVPTGATTGNVVVTVSSTASNGKLFTVVAAPGITSLSTTTGAVGTSVTITGTNFGATQGSSTVKFNGTTATPSSWNATSIAVPVPVGATTGNVVVHASGVDSNGKSFTVLPTPSITSLSPTSGAVGASITITGTNFGSTQGTSTVKFNGTTATASSWNATSIVAAVPSGATTGNVVVTVSGVASVGKSFTVVAAPNIISLSPTSGSVAASITITGTNFGATQGASTVKFNGTSATPTSWSATSIAVTVPSGASTGNVVVHASGVDSNGQPFTVLATPSITSLSPTSGAVGASVTITGTNFGGTQGTSTVKFNTTVATAITSWSATSIIATVPTGAATGNVVVTVSGVVSNTKAFTVVAAPNITSLSPTSGIVGTLVTVTGTNFGSTQGSGTVSFNGIAATAITSWTSTSIKAKVPANASSGNVVVHASGVDSAGVSFTVVVPIISGISPNSGAAGTSVTISGSNFGSTQGTGTVTFNGVVATDCPWSATSIVCAVPPGASTGPVLVTSGAGSVSNGVTFTVVPAPSITSVSPTSGQIGTPVTISGSNFGSSPGSVLFNGATATIATWTPTTITTTVPTGATTGTVTVHASGINSNSASFTVIFPPALSRLQPTSVPAGGTIAIYGSNFGPDSTISFNGVAGTVSAVTSSVISAVLPSGATSGNVVVTSSGLGSNALAFSVTPAPVLSNITPLTGGPGTAITITGTNFGASVIGGAVKLNGLPISPTSWSDTSVTASVASYSSTGPVVVSVAGVDSNSLSFTVTPATPAIDSILPNSAPVGALLTINGSGFGTGGTVQFNGVSGIATSWSDTTIAVPVPAGATSGPVSVTANGNQSNAATFALLITPNIATISPSSGQVGTSVSLQGTGFGLTQGNGWVVINGTPATISSWTDTQIAAVVQAGTKSGSSLAYVTANGIQSNGQTFTVIPPSGPPSSLTISPSTVSMVVGDTKALSLVGDGQSMTGATWTTSNGSVFSVSTTNPGEITAVAAGTATLTATLGSQTANATVTVFTTSLPVGTTVWEAAATPGLSDMSLIGAESATVDDPDTYSIETLSTPQQASLVRAFNSEGKLLWSAQDGGVPEWVVSSHTDPLAGLVRVIQRDLGGGQSVNFVNKRDPHTGQETWRYTSPLGVGQLYQNQAVDSAGTVYVLESVEPNCNSSKNATFQLAGCTYTRVVALDGQNGRPKFTVDFPKNHSIFYDYCRDPNYSMADTAEDWYQSPGGSPVASVSDQVGSIAIGPDDTVYVPFASFHLQQYGDCTSVSANDEVALGLLTIRPDGSSSSSKLVTFPWVFGQTQNGIPFPPQTNLSPRNVIPTNTPGEVLVNWIETDDSLGQYGGPHFQTKITRVTSTGVNTYSTPSANQTQMVIGENNIAYGLGELGVSAFDLATGTTAWTTSSSDNLSVATATGVSTVSSSGVTVYDQSGQPTSYNLGIKNSLYRSFGKWAGVSASLAPSAMMTPSVDVAASVAGYGTLSRGTRNAASFDFELVWCEQGSCSNIQDQDVTFSYYQSNPTVHENDAITLTSPQQLIVRRNALNALGLAFSKYSVRVGEGHQGTNTVYVAGEEPQLQGSVPCADTRNISFKLSRDYYMVNMRWAQWAVNAQTGQPTSDILNAIGEGLGNNAAHEIAHQLVNAYSASGKVVNGMGLHDDSTDTYNGGSCAGDLAPWVYTGVGTDGQTPIHWGSDADQSMINILGKNP